MSKFAQNDVRAPPLTKGYMSRRRISMAKFGLSLPAEITKAAARPPLREAPER